MRRTDIALKFLSVSYENWDAEDLRDLLSSDLEFIGPFYSCRGAPKSGH